MTEPNDLVVNIFAGSNTTGYVAEIENRRWLAFEEIIDYLSASIFRFMQDEEYSLIKETFGLLEQGKTKILKPKRREELIY